MQTVDEVLEMLRTYGCVEADTGPDASFEVIVVGLTGKVNGYCYRKDTCEGGPFNEVEFGRPWLRDSLDGAIDKIQAVVKYHTFYPVYNKRERDYWVELAVPVKLHVKARSVSAAMGTALELMKSRARQIEGADATEILVFDVHGAIRVECTCPCCDFCFDEARPANPDCRDVTCPACDFVFPYEGDE